MKLYKIFKIIMVVMAITFILGTLVYSFVAIASKNNSNTEKHKKETEEQSTEQTTEQPSEQTTEQEKTTEQLTETQQTTEAQQTTETVQQLSPETRYGSILNLYKRALSEAWDMDILMENGLNYMCMYHKGTGLNDVGYTFYDINLDGIEELIVGDEGYIFDVYTYQDNQVMLVAQSGERIRYGICENGVISLLASGGAARTYYVYYMLEPNAGELNLIECIAFNFDLNPDNPYFYTTSDFEDETLYTQIDEETADEIMRKYQGVDIGTLKPFEQYDSFN
ncbi:MAG: hypothetical protein NC393_04020 [Clostridium sp.]|nr:hypothetical protein [Clostridium sp.]MCM1171275.1 hypothetical protein [Clostridium sp.]MCM1207455.1 hypothetical protein [Ruminococcus sp.]